MISAPIPETGVSRTQTSNQLKSSPGACALDNNLTTPAFLGFFFLSPQALTSGFSGLGALWESDKTMERTHIEHASNPQYRTVHSMQRNVKSRSEVSCLLAQKASDKSAWGTAVFSSSFLGRGQDLDETTDFLRSVMEAYSKI